MNVLTHLNTLERLGQLIFISSYLFIYKSPNQADEPLKKRSINSVKGTKTCSNLKGESFLEKRKKPHATFLPFLHPEPIALFHAAANVRIFPPSRVCEIVINDTWASASMDHFICPSHFTICYPLCSTISVLHVQRMVQD